MCNSNFLSYVTAVLKWVIIWKLKQLIKDLIYKIISNRTYMYLKACAILREFLNIILKCKSLYVHVLIFINLQTNKMFLKKRKLYLIWVGRKYAVICQLF